MPYFLPLDTPLQFSLPTAGAAGLLGGDDAVTAMAAVPIHKSRLLGWYNTPGSAQIARSLDKFWSSSLPRDNVPRFLSQGVHTDPMALLGVDGGKGPKYRAAHSGTVIDETGSLAALFMKGCTAFTSAGGRVIPGRRTQPVDIIIADLGHTPAAEMRPARSSAFGVISAMIPISFSFGTCALSAVCGDLYASSLIFVGIVAGGISSLVLGSAEFVFTHPEPAKGSPAGDGILGSDKEIVLLRGSEGAVNSITRGNFTLRFSNAAHFGLLRWCSVLFVVQCIAQLLFIPQASLYGQVMFLVSFGASTLYNAWLSSMDKEKIYRQILFQSVLDNPTLTRYTLGTRTTAVVFILLVLRQQDPTKLLNELLPNDTKVWKLWKTTIIDALRRPTDKSFSFKAVVADLSGFTDQERDLLGLLLEDARSAFSGYKDYLHVDAL